MNSFEKNVIDAWKEKGRLWLQQLPVLVEQSKNFWNLTDLQPVSNLSYNYIAYAHQDTRPVVLKLGCDLPDITREYNALMLYHGHGSAQVLDKNFELQALLLERLIPGNSLKPLFPEHDAIALQHTVEVMKQLHATDISAVHGKFPTSADITKQLYDSKYESIFGEDIVRARALLQDLLATQAKQVLLHGDLHHDNILMGSHGWVAIDPKGIIGEPAYEVYPFIKNPIDSFLKQPNPELIMHRRLRQFSELMQIGYDRLWQWCYVLSVLDACWAFDDGQGDLSIALAETNLLMKIKS